ncbi:MAG: tetratricopeptide repeat protein [Bacteroidetes bacterium]|nr:tetratricopeptide repeat protein [Bacteroidota bacterium]
MKNFIYPKFISLGVFLLIFTLIVGCQKKGDDKIPITSSSNEAVTDFLEGRDLFEKLELRESHTYFENAISKDNEFAIAYYYHALSNPTTKGFFEDLKNAVAFNDKTSKGEKLIILALKAGVDGNQKKQGDYLTQLVDLYPNDERAHVQLGQFYFGQQKYQKAVDHLKTSTEINPDYSSSYNMLGYSHRNLGNFDAAEESFKKYIELIPDDPNPYDSYAELLMKLGRYEESITQYKKALSMDPDFFASHMGVSNNYIYMGEFDKAKENCEACYVIAKNDGERRFALFTLAVANVYEGNTDNAIDLMIKRYGLANAIRDPGAMATDLAIMGNILFEAGRYEEAKEKYEESLATIEVSNLSDEVKENAIRVALYRQGRILLMTGNVEEAKAKAMEFSKQSNAANNTFQIWLSHDLNGIIALNEKDYKKAQDEFMNSSQQNPYTFYNLALAYAGDNNKEKAMEYCEKSVNFNALANMNQAFVTEKAEKMLASL